MPDQNQDPGQAALDAIAQAAQQNVGRSPSISQANITLRNSANKHAEIIDAILSGPTNDTAIEVKNVTLATASILLRMLADAL